MKEKLSNHEKKDHFLGSIVDMESMIHYEFSHLRLGKGKNVYYGGQHSQLYRELDMFCAIETMYEKQGPLILYGPHGSGKSTALANWIAKRKKYDQTSISSSPEYIFYHAVGCSRQSIFVSKLLERILTELKDFFELSKEIPANEDKISWEFPRFLDAAAQKGRVILVIDGLHRLRTNDGEGILKWLPLSFPPNVRIIFTGTLKHALDEHRVEKKTSIVAKTVIDRVQVEGTRRNWHCVSSQAFQVHHRREMILQVLLPPNAIEPRVILFPIQCEAIAQSDQCANPSYLKHILTGLIWAAQEGLNIHQVLEDWIQTKTPVALYEAMLRTMERGYVPSERAKVEAKTFSMEHREVIRGASETTSGAKKKNSLSETFDEQQQKNPQEDREDDSDHDDVLEPETAQEHTSIFEYTETGADATEEDYTVPSMLGSPTSMDSPPAKDEDDKSSEDYSEEDFSDDFSDEAQEEEDVVVVVVEPPITIVVEPAPESQPLKSTTRQAETIECDVSLTPKNPVHENNHASPRTTGSPESSTSSHVEPNDNDNDNAKIGSEHLTFGMMMQHIPAYEDLPNYLTGGAQVCGLERPLGIALALLHVARHGLHISELRDLIELVLSRENKSASQECSKARDQDEFANLSTTSSRVFQSSTRDDNHDPSKLSNDDWAQLQRALPILGVIEAHSILILPFCVEGLRDCIWWRYLGSERMERRYHEYFILYFEAHAISFRRVEELPWHYNCCYRWKGLKDCLANIDTFRLFFTSTFKGELNSYWTLLSHGPLYVAPPLAAPESSRDEDLPQLLPPEEQRVVPFDLVKEYTKSLEDWYNVTKPTTSSLTTLIDTITKFIYEYSTFANQVMAEFNHPLLNMEDVQAQGISLPEQLLNSESSSSELYYLYHRWVWIQFPWIALTNKLQKVTEELPPAKTRTRRKDALGDIAWKVKKSLLQPAEESILVSNPNKLFGRLSASIKSNVVSLDTMDVIGLESRESQRQHRRSSIEALKSSISVVKDTASNYLPPAAVAVVNPGDSSPVVKNSTTTTTTVHLPKLFVVSEAKKVKKTINTTAASASGYLTSLDAGMTVPNSGNISAITNPLREVEWEIKKELNRETLYRLKHMYNQIHLETKVQRQRLKGLKQAHREMKLNKTTLERELEEGQHAMEIMSSRMTALTGASEKVLEQGLLYQRVVDLCQKYPSCNKLHLATCKKKLRIAQLQLRKKEDQMQFLTDGRNHLRSFELPALEAEYAKATELRNEIVSSLLHTKTRIESDKVTRQKLLDLRKTIIQGVHSNWKNLDAAEERELEENLSKQKTDMAVIHRKKKILKSALNECESVCSKIKAATGLSDLDSIYQKFINREEFQRNLVAQALEYENRFVAIRNLRSELESELMALQLQEARAKGKSSRAIENQLKETMMTSSQVANQLRSSKHNYKDALLGLSHIAELVGLQSVSDPRADLVRANELWPPRREQTAFLYGDLIHSSMEDIHQVIQVCESRVLAILEAVEHGGGDPDLGFTTVSRVQANAAAPVQALPSKVSTKPKTPETPELSTVTENRSTATTVGTNCIKKIRSQARRTTEVDFAVDKLYRDQLLSEKSQSQSPEEDVGGVLLSRDSIKASSKKQIMLSRHKTPTTVPETMSESIDEA